MTTNKSFLFSLKTTMDYSHLNLFRLLCLDQDKHEETIYEYFKNPSNFARDASFIDHFDTSLFPFFCQIQPGYFIRNNTRIFDVSKCDTTMYHLTASMCEDLEKIVNAENVLSIKLSGCKNIEEISFGESTPNLQILMLVNGTIRSHEQLERVLEKTNENLKMVYIDDENFLVENKKFYMLSQSNFPKSRHAIMNAESIYIKDVTFKTRIIRFSSFDHLKHLYIFDTCLPKSNFYISDTLEELIVVNSEIGDIISPRAFLSSLKYFQWETSKVNSRFEDCRLSSLGFDNLEIYCDETMPFMEIQRCKSLVYTGKIYRYIHPMPLQYIKIFTNDIPFCEFKSLLDQMKIRNIPECIEFQDSLFSEDFIHGIVYFPNAHVIFTRCQYEGPDDTTIYFPKTKNITFYHCDDVFYRDDISLSLVGTIEIIDQ
jgi:hypothetical protein